MPFITFVTYPTHPKNAIFNIDYYINKHVPLTEKLWGPKGLLSWQVVQYKKDDPSSTSKTCACWCVPEADHPGIFIQAILTWKSEQCATEAREGLFGGEFPELLEDPKHYYPLVLEDQSQAVIIQSSATVLGRSS